MRHAFVFAYKHKSKIFVNSGKCLFIEIQMSKRVQRNNFFF